MSSDIVAVIKEVSIFAIRNLCDGNRENQKIIEALEARGVADNPVLGEAGLEAVIDEAGKLRLKPREPSPPPYSPMDTCPPGAKITEVEL